MHGKKRILFLNHWAQNPGGAEYSLMDIMKLAAIDFECTLLTTEQGILTKYAEKLGINVLIVPVNKRIASFKRNSINPIKYLSFLYFIPYTIKVKKLIGEIKPDLIHANIPKSHILLLLLLRNKKDLSGIIHMREIFKNPLVRLLYSLLFNKQTKVIAISEAVYKHLPNKLKKNSEVIYNGISIPNNSDISKSKSSIKLIYLGRVVPWKGCHHLIKILKLVRSKDPDNNYQLDIYGDTIYWNQNYREHLKTLIKKYSLESYCKIHNAIKDIDEILNKSNIFVNASDEEPFGRVLAEASAHSLPVITFSSGGAKEIITPKTGILVEKSSIKDFSDAIIKLSNNPELSRILGDAGKKRAAQLFNKDKQLKKIISYLNNILGNNHNNGN